MRGRLDMEKSELDMSPTGALELLENANPDEHLRIQFLQMCINVKTELGLARNTRESR